jgi:hypothetical protein
MTVPLFAEKPYEGIELDAALLKNLMKGLNWMLRFNPYPRRPFSLKNYQHLKLVPV